MTSDKRRDIEARLAQLESAGKLTPADVVEDAKDPLSPLHSEFDWDVQSAAEKWWLEQSRSLIRSVRIQLRTETTELTSVAYVHDPRADQQGYISVLRLKDDKVLAREALLNEVKYASAALARAREVAVALGFETQLSDITARLHELRELATVAHA